VLLGVEITGREALTLVVAIQAAISVTEMSRVSW
jgi:hypothetical protein